MPVPTNLSKSSNRVKNDVVKKAVYNKLVAKVDNIDTSKFILKTKYDTVKNKIKFLILAILLKKRTITDYNTNVTEVEGKTPDISNLATKTVLTTVENKIPDTSNLATKTLFRKVENKIPDISNLVKKSDYNTKITDIENNVKNL